LTTNNQHSLRIYAFIQFSVGSPSSSLRSDRPLGTLSHYSKDTTDDTAESETFQ